MTDDSQRLIDEILVLDCQHGEAEAMRELVARWQKRFWRHALYLTGNPEAAWDVTQESWLGIVRGIGQLREPSRFREWGFQIVTNKARDWIKRRKGVPYVELDEVAIAEDSAAEKRDSAADVLRVLRRVSPEHRAILTLYYFEQLRVAEVARVLDIPAGTVKSRLYAARNEFREAWTRLADEHQTQNEER